jgi:hypothetical protein
MGSLSERHQQALAKWREWRRWSHSDNVAALVRADKALLELHRICAPELAEALREGGVREITQENQAILQDIAWAGIYDAAQTLADQPGRDVLEYAKACFSKALAKFRAVVKRTIREAPPEQVLDTALELPSDGTSRMLDLLSNEQQREVIGLAMERLLADPRTKQVICGLGDEHEPEDDLLWIVWYIGRSQDAALHAERIPVRDRSGSRPTITVVGQWDEHGRPKGPPKGKSSDPPNLAGPINTRIWLELAREKSKHGLCIPDPQSLGRITRLSGFSRDIARRWRDHPQFGNLGEITPDGSGGVYANLSLEDVLRSIEIFDGRKPGPNPHHPSE